VLGFNVEERPHSSVRHEVEFGRVVGRVLGRMYHMYRIYRKGTIAPTYAPWLILTAMLRRQCSSGPVKVVQQPSKISIRLTS
jgi:hypothetical protein